MVHLPEGASSRRRSQAAVVVALLLAAIVPVAASRLASDPKVRSSPVPPDMLIERLRRHVSILAGTIGERNVFRPPGAACSRRPYSRRVASPGYQVTSHRYAVAGVPSENLEVTVKGMAKAEEILLIGAHYDSVQGSPGANDNASGVVALLELSRDFVRFRPARIVRFVAFVNEEPPFFASGQMGSTVYARPRERGATTSA